MPRRRQLLSSLPLLAAIAGGGAAAQAGGAQAPKPARFPGDPPEHKVVYQLNVADPQTIEHILNSIGAMIGRYADNVAIAVVAFGPGIHLLARKPGRPMPAELRERARSQAASYGVSYVACGNTLRSLGWGADDIVDFARIEEVGAAALMERQEQGYAYIAW